MDNTQRRLEAVRDGNREEVQIPVLGWISIFTATDSSRRLLEAVKNGNLQEVQRLVRDEILLEEVEDGNGNTPLHYAALFGRISVVEYLVEAGAPVNSKNNRGCIPLHSAALYGRVLVVEYLLNSGADYLALSNEGETAKDLANCETVRNLLQEWEDNCSQAKEPDCC